MHRDYTEDGSAIYLLTTRPDADEENGWAVMGFFPIVDGKVVIPSGYAKIKTNYGGEEYLTSSSDDYAKIIKINENFIKKGRKDGTFYDGMETGQIKIFFDELRRSEEASERLTRVRPKKGSLQVAGQLRPHYHEKIFHLHVEKIKQRLISLVLSS